MNLVPRPCLVLAGLLVACGSDPPPPRPDPVATPAPLAPPGGDVATPPPSPKEAFPTSRPITLGGFEPDDDRPIDLPMAPAGWPAWKPGLKTIIPEPPSNASTARALAHEIEQDLIPVPRFDDIPWEWRQRAQRFDGFLFLEAAHAWEPRDLKAAYRPAKGIGQPSFVIARRWTVGSDGAHVRLDVVEALSYAIIRLRPLEWLDASLEDRVAWTRVNLPRYVRIRGFDEGFTRRADIDLRYRPTGPRTADLSTPEWSTWSPNWYDRVYGWIDDPGVTLLISRRHRHGGKSFEQ